MNVAASSKGWTNKLIWGDNKLILSSPQNGPLREDREAGRPEADLHRPRHSMWVRTFLDIEIGGDTFTKKPNILEEIAYHDTGPRARIRSSP